MHKIDEAPAKKSTKKFRAFAENERTANEYTSVLLLVFEALIVLEFAIALSGIAPRMNVRLMSYSMIPTAILLLLPFFLVRVFKIQGWFIKYLVAGLSVMTILVSDMVLTYATWTISFLPVILICHYYDKPLTIYTLVALIVGLAGSTLVGLYLGLWDYNSIGLSQTANVVTSEVLLRAFTNSYLPRVFCLLAMGIIAIRLSTRTHNMGDRLASDVAEKERLSTELSVATTIQNSMLPNIFPCAPNYVEIEVYATMSPAKEVGGDFYDFFDVDDDHFAILIADVSGKGVPAAMFMVIAKTLIKDKVQSGMSPTEAMDSVNKQLIQGNGAGMFVTAWLGVLEISTGILSYVNAGHNAPFVRRREGGFEPLPARSGLVLAGRKKTKYKPLETRLDAGDSIFLYTDGVSEAMNVAHELYGEDRLKVVLDANATVSCVDMLAAVRADVDAFAGEEPQFDDITMLCLHVSGSFREITVPAEVAQIPKVTDFVNSCLADHDVNKKTHSVLDIVIDEILSNIANYSESEEAIVGCCVFNHKIHLRFVDQGKPYDPTQSEVPDVTLAAKDRRIGGLGVFLSAKMTDSFTYEYINDCNITVITKNLS